MWVRGQVTAGAKQQETPARGSLVMPRHQVSERDSARMNDTDHGNWRRGQTVKSYKESILVNVFFEDITGSRYFIIILH